MDRSRTMTYGAGLLFLAMIALSAWTYLGQQVDDHTAMAGAVSSEEPLPEDHPEIAGEEVALDESGLASSSVTAQVYSSDEESSGTESFTAADASGAVSVDAAVLTEGSVSADGTLAPLSDQLAEGEFGILLTFNTHSVNLSGYDFVALGSLSTGGKEIAPSRWISESDDSHHRSGVLVFPADEIDLASTGRLSLTLLDIDAVPERTLTWSLPLS